MISIFSDDFGFLQLGAFYPFARDHSAKDTIRQELYLWDSVAETSRKVLGLRYRLLPYFYMLMYEAHMKGTAIARPLFFSFPDDIKTSDINSQFLIGKGIMVSPVLKQGAVSVDAYFPAGKWFGLVNYSRSVKVSHGKYIKLDVPSDYINVHLREGNILAMKKDAMTTELARKIAFELVVVVSKSENSTGEVFLDDGVGIEMGGEGGKWSLIKLKGLLVGKTVKLETEVVNGEFASSQKWVVEKVIFLGLENIKRVKGYRLILNLGRKLGGNSGVKVTFDGSGSEFGVVEVSGMSQIIGKEFSLEVDLS